MHALKLEASEMQAPSRAADSVSNGRRVHYLCFQVTREGQASHAHVHGILRGLERRGWQTALLQPDDPGGRETSLWRKAFSSLGVQWRLWTADPPPDILYYRMHPAALLSVLWARLRGIPTVGEVNGTFADVELIYPFLLPLMPLIYCVSLGCLRLSSALITVTGSLAEWLRRKCGRTPVYVVSNGADTELFRPNCLGKRPLDNPYVVFVGAMSPWQGVDTLLAAVERPEWPEEVKLLFVGSGMERRAVERAAKKGTRVLYWGQMPHRSIPRIIAGSLAGLSTQNRMRGRNARYGFSAIKVYEAMACGVPVIVTDFPGQGDLVREARAGLVVQPEDAAGIALAVSFLYSSPDAVNEMGACGRKAVEQFHTWQHRADQTEIILLEALRKHAGTKDGN